jgi:hypothetical protein
MYSTLKFVRSMYEVYYVKLKMSFTVEVEINLVGLGLRIFMFKINNLNHSLLTLD